MGCSSSKRRSAAIVANRPWPASFSVFNVDTVHEPWLKKHALPHASSVPRASAHAPKPWAEVRKALEDSAPSPTEHVRNRAPKIKNKSSFHTVDEYEKKLLWKKDNFGKLEAKEETTLSFSDQVDSVKRNSDQLMNRNSIKLVDIESKRTDSSPEVGKQDMSLISVNDSVVPVNDNSDQSLNHTNPVQVKAKERELNRLHSVVQKEGKNEKQRLFSFSDSVVSDKDNSQSINQNLNQSIKLNSVHLANKNHGSKYVNHVKTEIHNSFNAVDDYLNTVTSPSRNSDGLKPVMENPFVVRDRLLISSTRERGDEKLKDSWESEFPAICPPGGANAVILYTTSLRGVRRTHEDCIRARALLEGNRVLFEERDVALHGEFLSELRTILGKTAALPRFFVKGRYIGGVDEMVGFNESGRLGELLSRACVERGLRACCEVCGGRGFVPCLECRGSCKAKGSYRRSRCMVCNENGLIRCPVGCR